jgi:hypothetical protein
MLKINSSVTWTSWWWHHGVPKGTGVMTGVQRVMHNLVHEVGCVNMSTVHHYYVTKIFLLCNRSTNIIRVIKSRLRWAGHVVRVGERRSPYRVLVGKPEGRRPYGRTRLSWGTILKLIFERGGGGGCMDWIDLGQVAGSCECCKEPSGSINAEKFFD